MQDAWIDIKLLQNKTSLGKTTSCKWLWRDAGDRDSDSWVGLNQVWLCGKCLDFGSSAFSSCLTLPMPLPGTDKILEQVKTQSLCFPDFSLPLPKLEF